MNQRIKELAKEAAVVYQKTLPPATHTTPLYLIDKLGKDAKDAGIEIVSDGFCEKFAELIVKDVLGCYNAIDNGNTVEGTDDFVKAVAKRYDL